MPAGDSSAMGTSSVARAGCAGRAKPWGALPFFFLFVIVASASAAATEEEELEELEERDAASAVAAWAMASSRDAGIGGSFLDWVGEDDGEGEEEEEEEEGFAPKPRFEEEEAATTTAAAAADRALEIKNRLLLLSLSALLVAVGAIIRELLAARERSIVISVRGGNESQRCKVGERLKNK